MFTRLVIRPSRSSVQRFSAERSWAVLASRWRAEVSSRRWRMVISASSPAAYWLMSVTSWPLSMCPLRDLTCDGPGPCCADFEPPLAERGHDAHGFVDAPHVVVDGCFDHPVPHVEVKPVEV